MADEVDIVSEEEPIVHARQPEFDVVSLDGDEIDAPMTRRRPRVIKTNSTDKTCALLVVSNERSVECDVIDNLWAIWHPLSFTVIRIMSGYLMF